MQGVFDSTAPGTNAVTAVGSNGANGILASGRIAISAGSKEGVGIAASNVGQGIGVRATSDAGWAVNAQSTSGIGVLGTSDTGVGIQGVCQAGDNFGVVGEGPNAGVAAFNPNNDHAAYLASECCAAWFTGGVTVTGKISKGGGGFRIDHPSDPEKKYLNHSFVESPDMKNLYDGVAVADKNGEASVVMPAWFDLINQEFRYQLTALGVPAPGLYISQEIKDNRFAIAGGKAGMRISWQVTGTRKDPWAVANCIIVEEKKIEKEQGYYLHPELFKAGVEKAIGVLRHPRKESNLRMSTFIKKQ